jgi:L-serine dehydratase
VRILALSEEGEPLAATAKSTGGGGILFTEIDGRPARIDGKSYATLVVAAPAAGRRINRIMAGAGGDVEPPRRGTGKGGMIFVWMKGSSLDPEKRARIESILGVRGVRTAAPVFYARKGVPLFLTMDEAVRLSKRRRESLGKIALDYESRLLGVPEDEVLAEIMRRYAVMKASVERGLKGSGLSLKLLRPTAGKIMAAGKSGGLAAGGWHARAAARAMAVLHVANSRGIICAAPTGGSAGVLPGVVVTMAEERKVRDREIGLGLLAAGAVGLVFDRRATFAAEVAGCQVEIGAAGAMAAAAVVEMAGGRAVQAADAAAVALQNTMGSVCDLVMGMCEIPCHTRNAAAAASAFVCADLVLGGYRNPIPLDETIDAAFASGRMLPAELRCTARGGIAQAPSALVLPRGMGRRR